MPDVYLLVRYEPSKVTEMSIKILIITDVYPLVSYEPSKVT